MLSNTQMALFKAEPYISREYSRLCGNTELGGSIYNTILDEYKRTITQVLEITGGHGLLDDMQFRRHAPVYLSYRGSRVDQLVAP